MLLSGNCRETDAGGLEGGPVSLDILAGMLARLVGKPVINMTALEGNYDLKLRYADEGETNSNLPRYSPRPGNN